MNILKSRVNYKVTSKFSLRFFQASDVSITLSTNKKPKIQNEKLEWGKYSTDHMLKIEWNRTKGWGKPEIVPWEMISIDPMAPVFHYAIGAFDNMKAFRADDDTRLLLFRPRLHLERFQDSAKRVAFPEFSTEELLKLIKLLVEVDKDWVPKGRGYSLYIRPTILGVTPQLGVKPADDALLFIVLSPVGAYFPSQAIKLFADPNKVRSWKGGACEHKIGANYSGTIQTQQIAADAGYNQVLWLTTPDKYITEIGQMNFFTIWKSKNGGIELRTAPLDDHIIIPGIIRQSIIEIAKEMNLKVVEEYDTIDQLTEAVLENRVIEMFGCGTGGARLCRVSGYNYLDKEYNIELPPSHRSYTLKLQSVLESIQYGTYENHPWTEEINLC